MNQTLYGKNTKVMFRLLFVNLELKRPLTLEFAFAGELNQNYSHICHMHIPIVFFFETEAKDLPHQLNK